MMKMLIRSVNYQVGETAAAAAGLSGVAAVSAWRSAWRSARLAGGAMAAAETMKGYSHVVTS